MIYLFLSAAGNYVSLPGADASSSAEQPTILEVLNKVQTTSSTAAEPQPTESTKLQSEDLDEALLLNADVNAQATSQPPQESSPVTDERASSLDDNLQSHIAASDNLVSSNSETSNSSSRVSGSSTATTVPAATFDRQTSSQDNVLDIESHLIETYDDYQTHDDSVGIKELPPIKDELTQGSSKIETDANVRTVIEVEPAGVKTKQPIATLVQSASQPPHLKEADIEIAQHISEDIRQTAEKLVSEIEREVLETLRSQQIAAQTAHAKPASKSSRENNESSRAEPTLDEKTDQLSALLDDLNSTLSQRVDEQLSEVTSILKATRHAEVALNLSGVNGERLNVAIDKPTDQLKIVDGPSPKTALEAEERKLFIDSLPQIEANAAANKLAADCKREYYQSLKKYLVQDLDKPPVPLQTYRWEDLKRAKERGGYPWTHLYKRPLGPDEEPEIVLMLRKSQELRFTSESPKSLKKVRIDEQVLVKEAERYIQELTDDEEDHEDQPSSAKEDEENHSLHSESISCASDSVLAVGKPRKANRFGKIRGILKHRKSGRTHEDAQSLPGTSTHTSRHHSEENLAPEKVVGNGKSPEHKPPRCYPIMKKLKSMADRQKKRLNIKRITLRKDEKIVLGEETKILKLKNSPKSERGEIPHFIEKQDSDDVLEIVELDESPGRSTKRIDRELDEEATLNSSIVEPDEIIEIEQVLEKPEVLENQAPIVESITKEAQATATTPPPKKAPRLRREHVYEEIEQGALDEPQINEILETAAVEQLKESLAKQDNSAFNDIEKAKAAPLDRMGSSEEDQITTEGKPTMSLMAPISSIDSTSSDEDRTRPQLSPVAEESDAGSMDVHLTEREAANVLKAVAEHEQTDLRPSIKKEASPAPSDKKVTFSHVEDEAEPHREDIELPAEIREATAASAKWKNMNDHEYEPIGLPSVENNIAREASPAPIQAQNHESKLAMEIDELRNEMKDAEDLQKDLEERYFSSEATTPRTESRTDYEIHTSQVDSSALEELPLKPENRKKGFMASAQDRTRKMQAGFKSQAGRIKTKLRSPAKKASPSSSPKAKERRRFKAPEFSKIKMPEIKRPDMSKLKEFKRPEFTKFSKPDMSKFKLPEKFSTLKLKRSKSFKENETAPDDETSGVTPDSGVNAEAQPHKRMFDFNFGTYPRAFRKKKKPAESQSSFFTGTATEDPSIIPSTETQPSVESSSSPQGDRGPGPVRSRWADKFSDVSYNDSEGSRYRRYGSEQESFDRESSLERRMKEDLEDTGSEAQDMGILGGVPETKEFAEFDEENRAIHEISNLRAGEFKRRPMVHQDSDLRSEDSKEAEGWTDKEIQKNKLLRKAELEAEASYLKYPSEEVMRQETQSTASSGKKVVMEEIDDDEFFLRKRGISEDNIELRQYISNAIREGYDMPVNALQHVGKTSEPMEYVDYDVPPPKPRRLNKSYAPEDVSQEFGSQRSDFGDDLSMSHNGSDFFGAPKRPMRKGRSRSKYSMDSQDIPMVDERISQEQYFDDDEDYLRPPPRGTSKKNVAGLNNLDYVGRELYDAEQDEDIEDVPPRPQPQAPRRRKRQLRESSMDKDSYVNGFSGRSVSNSYLQPTEDVIVFRTEHEYHHPPLATPENYTDGTSATHKSRSASRFDEDDRTSRGADSLTLDANLRAEYDEDTEDVQEKFIIDMMENDGYAVVRKEHVPKPTPPARRKKFSRSPGERFATMPNIRPPRSTPPPERPPPPQGYVPTVTDEPIPPRRKAAPSLEAPQNFEDDYEEPGALDQERPESPRNLQSGEIINKMKFRPLPPPPRPPREKRFRAESKGSMHDSRTDEQNSNFDDREDIVTSSTADSYDHNTDLDDDPRFAEVEVSTQTDPLPDDFVCEEFEITEDMRIIEPRRPAKTLEELLKAEQVAEEEPSRQMTEDEQLARGLQRFRDANQRSISERSRASSQADRSKSLSRPQTPSAVIIERVYTPVPSQHNETMLEASLIVRPIDDLDLEEEALRREGLLTDSEQQSKSEEEESKHVASDYSHVSSTVDLDAAIEALRSQGESERETEQEDEEVELAMREEEVQINEEAPERTMRDKEFRQASIDEEALERTMADKEFRQASTENEDFERTMRDKEFRQASTEEEAFERTMRDKEFRQASIDEEAFERTMKDKEFKQASIDEEAFERTMIDKEFTQASTDEEAFERTMRDKEFTPAGTREEVLDEKEVVLSRSDEEEAERTMLDDEEVEAFMGENVQIERTMRDYEYDDDQAEKYSDHYDEDIEPEVEAESHKEQLKLENVKKEMKALPTFSDYELDLKEDVREDPVKYDYERRKSEDREQPAQTEFERRLEQKLREESPPQPPPRRKSTTAIEPTASLIIVEQQSLTKEVAPTQSVVGEQAQAQFPSRVGDLEVERLRVHALQAGQIMVSQLHGAQISSDELECKSGSLVVKNIELPPGFIEDIVERVRSTDRNQLLTVETQTSLQASSEKLPTEESLSPVRELVPPPKPPRHRDLESVHHPPTQSAMQYSAANEPAIERLRNFDEETQTEPSETTPTSALPPQPLPVYPTAEYLQSLAPLAFYNLRKAEAAAEHAEDEAAHKCRHHRHHHHHHRRHDSSTSSELEDAGSEQDELKEQRHRSRSKSRSRPPAEPQTVAQAGRKFITACSLSLVNIINQLTTVIRRDADKDQDNEIRIRKVPTLVVLFIAITFALLVYLLSGRSVHTHHWDYFNPPGNDGRPS